jgi:PAS domain S-box-containing protein
MKTESGSQALEKLFMGEKIPDPGLDLVRASFDMVESFIIAIDLAGNVVLMNRRARELLGYEDEEIKGMSFFHQLLQKSQRSKTQIMFEELIGGGSPDPVFMEYSLLTRGRETITIKARMLPVWDGRDHILGILASGSDVTDIKKNARKLSESKEEAEELNLAKSEFLARVAHEIRTPLNAIMGFTEQLMQTGLDPRQKEFAGIIEKSSEHLHSLVNDILILSKIEARELNFEKSPFKLEHSMQYLHDSLIKKAEAKNLSITFKVDPRLDRVLIGDSFRLRQILLNLLNNAIKFTHQGYVRLKCTLQAETDDKVQVKFEVKDTGIGINPDKLEIIFEQFKQADSKKIRGDGTGADHMQKPHRNAERQPVGDKPAGCGNHLYLYPAV